MLDLTLCHTCKMPVNRDVAWCLGGTEDDDIWFCNNRCAEAFTWTGKCRGDQANAIIEAILKFRASVDADNDRYGAIKAQRAHLAKT